MKKVLPTSFFRRKGSIVAQELLGKYLVSRIGDKEIAFQITDVELYDGPYDRASHAFGGKTERNKIMFDAGGVWYVYFIYGMHWLLNIVVGEGGYPSAILIRGVEGIEGPARVARACAVGKHHYGLSAIRASNLWIEDRGRTIPPAHIVTLPRVGVSYAGEWADTPLRFCIANKQKL